MKKKTFAIIRAAAAAVIALVILFCSSFSFVTLFSGAVSVSDASELTEGSYVSADITYIMDICAVENDEAGEAVYYYAVAPVGNAFAVIRYPAADFEDVTNLENDTIAYLAGTNESMHFHMVTEGSVVDMPSEIYQYFASWFNDNATWMSQAGVIAAVDDYTTYLNTTMITADTIDGMSRTTAVVLNVVAALLLVYAIVELVLVFVGVYNKKPAKKAAKAKKAPAQPAAKHEAVKQTKAPAAAEPEAVIEAAPETAPEAAPEAAAEEAPEAAPETAE